MVVGVAGLQPPPEALASMIGFSVTLHPADYFRQLLDTYAETNWYRLPTPFPENTLLVTIGDYIDTSYRGHAESVQALVDLIYNVTSH